MDAGVTHNHNSWFLRLSEQALRAFAMGLVLTGQMLPSGAVSAQEDPPSPSFSAPPATAGLTSVTIAQEPPTTDEEALPSQEVEESTAAPPATESNNEEPASEALPPAAENEEPSADGAPAATESEPATEPEPGAESTPATDEAPAASVAEPAAESAPVSEAVPPAEEAQSEAATEAPAVEEAAPATEPTPMEEEAPAPTLPDVNEAGAQGEAVTDLSSDPTKYQIGDWTMTIRPGPVPPKTVREFHTPIAYEGLPTNQNNVSVPVNVNVNNLASQNWPWATPWANANYWNSPTAAYLFQHPQPYWQLRGDFYHLRPFIRGL